MYDDKKYIQTFKEQGEYPKIHDDIFSLHKFVKVKNVLDLGCCYGLLTHRLSTVYDNVVGVEPNKNYCRNLQMNKNIVYYNLKFDFNTLSLFQQILLKHSISAIYCRRVIPEIYNTGGYELLYKFKDILSNNNVEYIVLEGRIQRNNSVNPFSNLDKEIKIFEDKYEVIAFKNNAVVMVYNEEL